MEIEFDNLKKLQHIDVQLKEISAFLKDVPASVQDIEDKIKDSLQIVSEAKEKLAANQKKRRELEAVVQDTKSLVTKYKRQLGDVKTNREYTSLLHEITEAEKKADTLEEEIINEMLLADDIEEEIRKAEEKAAEAKEKFNEEKDVLLKKKEEQEEKKEQLLGEREMLVPRIPQEQMSLYSNIRKKSDGIALSPVNDEFCSMCHMRIRPQVLNELKEANTIILCENCGRILHF